MLETRFNAMQLKRILDQSMIYMCACPAQICKQLSAVRNLYDYQATCLNRTDTDKAVHQRIAETAKRAYADLESCLQDVLVLEGWDMQTLEMPACLQKKMFED